MYSVQVWYSVVLVFLLRESYVKGSTQWPGGEYVLLKPKTGCPNNWKDKAWILQDTKSKGSNNRSRILHIDGYVAPHYVVRSFCIRTGTKGLSADWPQGQYCIYGNKTFSSGSIKMTGDHDYNKDAVKYISSFVYYNDGASNGQKKHIKFHFKCQTRGNKKIPISLPITKPFYLLPYGSRDCQQVRWMVATTEWIKYQTENVINGTVPEYNLESNKGNTMFYCYYKSCNYTLTDKEGVLQSPGFPGKYPDGQLCSWRIMVPDNQIVKVRFANFSLTENDTLTYSKSINGSFRSWYTLPFNLTVPFTLSGESDVLFVFRSDESNNSSGFRAEYRVSIPQATTTITETSTASTATPSETSSTPLTTPRKTTKKKSSKPKKDDKQTTTQTTNSKSTAITKTNVSTITPQQTKTTQDPSSLTNCTAGNRVKEALTNSNEWNGKLVVILIPLACLLIVILLIVDIACRCRLKTKTSTDSASETRYVDQLPLVVNPTYDRGAFLLTQPNDTTTLTTILEVNENGTGTTQSVTDKPPDYEDIDNWKPKTPNPNMDPKFPECNGSNACSDTQGGLFDTTTTEGTNKTSENPFYESVLNSPPLVEANDLYESIKIDKEKAK